MANGDVIFVREFPSTVHAMSEVLTGALETLIAAGWLERGDEYGFARLCLEEALVNAITHGNKCDAARKVRLAIEEADDAVRIKVTDEGEGFRPDDIHMPDCGSMRGRGIGLIRHCMEGVSFNVSENCLIMTMRRKPFSKATGSGSAPAAGGRDARDEAHGDQSDE